MAGGNDYKEFDTISIIPSADSTVVIWRYRFRKRDVLFGGVTAVLLLTCFILSIVLGVVTNKKSVAGPQSAVSSGAGPQSAVSSGALTANNCSEFQTLTTSASTKPIISTKGSSSSTSGGTTTPSVKCTEGTTLAPSSGEFCETVPCLKAAMNALSSLDSTVDPCEDFYSFACGKYAEANPATLFLDDVTPMNQIAMENVLLLLRMLEHPVQDISELSYERKMKEFLHSCLDHTEKLNRQGQPFIESIVKPLGGWYLLNNWNISQFDLQSLLNVVTIDLWTFVFFKVDVLNKNHNWTDVVIEIDPYYFYRWYYFTEDQREYMGNLSTLILRDFGVTTPDNERLHRVIEDVLEVEKKMQQMGYMPFDFESHSHEKLKTLGQVNNDMNNTFDFLQFMRILFNESGHNFTLSTKVAVSTPEYLPKLGAIFSEYLATQEGKRKLHNYIIFVLLEHFHDKLSYDYTRLGSMSDWYWEENPSPYMKCLRVVEETMSEALNALFVKHFVHVENKNEGDMIMKKLVDQMLINLNNANWLTSQDKATSKNIISNSLYKIGFNNLLLNTSYMESLYEKVNISSTLYFENVINLHKLHKAEMNDLLRHPDDRSLWYYHVFIPVIEYYQPWRELIATVAVMQSPLFDHNGPDYYNFGSVGTKLASHLVNAVNELNNQFELDVSNYGSWWSNETLLAYKRIKKCAVDVVKNITLDPLHHGSHIETVDLNFFSDHLATTLMSRAAGLKLSYTAYKKLETQGGKEKLPAGVHRYTADQLFFVSHAQANCQNTPDNLKLIDLYMYSELPSKIRVNLDVSQLPEFSQAFNCQSGQKLFADRTCPLFS